MSRIITTKYGNVTIEKANQTVPYRLYRKFFKSKTDKKRLEVLLKKIILNMNLGI